MGLAQYLKLFGTLIAIGLSSGVAQPRCTLFVQPGQSLQNIIENAPAGAVICLVPGMWTQSMSVQDKILTLWGAGRDQTILMGTASTPSDGITISGGSIVTLRGLAIYNFRHGIVARGSSRVVLHDAQVSGNAGYGVYALGTTHTTVENSQISYNLGGVTVQDSAHSVIQYSQILNNKEDGIRLDFASTAWLVSNIIESNGHYGVRVYSLENLSVCWRNVVRNNRAGDFYPEMAAQRCL